MTMPRICVFDVNETLLDMSALDPVFERIFGDASVRPLWFSQVLQSALTATVTDAYSDFGATGMAALAMMAGARGTTLGDDDERALKDGMQNLPPHPEVEEGLTLLLDAGIRIATLTNSTQAVADAQLRNAGLSDLFELSLSADAVKRLKPAAAPYRMAAESLGVPLEGMRLVAAHSWDVAGALRAGCAAAFVARPGKVLDPLVARPDVTGKEVAEVARLIIEAET